MPDKPRPGSCALITIDVQRDFSRGDGSAHIAGTEEVLPRIAEATAIFRAAGRPIIHVVRLYLRDGSNAELSRRQALAAGASIVRPGTRGSELDRGLGVRECLDHELLLSGGFQSVGPGEWVMFKPRWGAFFETGLREKLDDLAVDSLVVVGVNFPNCPRTTVYEASERDFRVLVVGDAISGAYDRGLAECRSIGAQVLTTARLETWLGGDELPG